MSIKSKGIILDNPDDERELYMELNTNYYPKESQARKIIYQYEDSQDANAFGDILNLYGTNESFVFICKRGRFVYTCPINSVKSFNGMRRVTNDNIEKRTGVLDDSEKQRLIENLSDALEIDRNIPEKAKEIVSDLVLKYKANNNK